MSLSTPCLPSRFQSGIHFLPAVYHRNWFLLLTASAPALSEMTVQDVLETQSLQLLERSCENFAPIQNNKKRLIISIWVILWQRYLRKEWVLRSRNHSLIRLKGIFTGREQLSVFDLSKLASGKRHTLNTAQLPVRGASRSRLRH